MTRRPLFTLLMATALIGTAVAGEIQGKVSGAAGTSVVYVDAIPGKTFPPPSQHFQIDQKGLMFQPHVLVIPVGATVDFQNSDSVQHNLFWPSINGNKKLGHNLGTWPKGERPSFQFELGRSRYFATSTRRCRAISSSVQLRTSSRPTVAETSRSAMYRMASTTW